MSREGTVFRRVRSLQNRKHSTQRRDTAKSGRPQFRKAEADDKARRREKIQGARITERLQTGDRFGAQRAREARLQGDQETIHTISIRQGT
ncbi:hypothetical protein NPIL_116371 [Nephila pilipes]|uniref:Uncharacterized protein n=1 Tax=Nephila pilipes TaxID=299642 RepID=A0A8X6Q2Q4_NEPPI|nr:hypothetical protein NPIL_116371 [Nephila pilipes]